MKNKDILLVNIPFTFVEIKLCPLEQVSIETLKLISMLKDDNEVSSLHQHFGRLIHHQISYCRQVLLPRADRPCPTIYVCFAFFTNHFISFKDKLILKEKIFISNIF